MADRPQTTVDAVDPDVDLRVPRNAVNCVAGLGRCWRRLRPAGSSVPLPDMLLTWLSRMPPARCHGRRSVINVSGCALIGVLMVLVENVWTGRRLLRPFLGVGVLGGYTTFSTYVLDVNQAVGAGSPGIALLYLAARRWLR